MAANTQGFKSLAAVKYKGVQIDLLEGHIHEFKATFIAVPIPTNQLVFQERFSAKERRKRLQKLTAAQRLFEAAGDADGKGALSNEVKRGATGAVADREGSVKVTSAYGLEPGVKRIIHAYHPKFASGGGQAALARSLERLRDTYTSIFEAAYGDESYVPGMKIALSPLGTELEYWRAPQSDGTIIALKAICSFIKEFITKKDPEKKLPVQVAIILPPAEEEDVRVDKRDEAFRLELEQHYVEELPKQFKNSLAAPATPATPATAALSSAASSAKPIETPAGKPSTGKPTGRPPGAPMGKPPLSPLMRFSEASTPKEDNDDDTGDQPNDNNDNHKNTPKPYKNWNKFVEAILLPNAISSRKYDKVLIQLCAGDIAKFPSAKPDGPPYARILVTDAAIELDGNGGPDDAAIHASAGPLLKAALADVKNSDEYVNERTRVWTTGSYNLGLIGVRRIIHAIGPIYHVRASEESKDKKEDDLKATYKNVFEEAIKPENDRANMMVALSFLSTNRNNFPYDRATWLALTSVMDLVDKGKDTHGGINHVVFVVPHKNDPRVEEFKDAIDYFFPGEKSPSYKDPRGKENKPRDASDSDNGDEGPSNPMSGTTSRSTTTATKTNKAQKDKEEKAKKDADKKKSTQRAGKKVSAKEAAAAAAKESDAKAQLLRDQLRDTFKAREPETLAQTAARLKAEAEEDKRRREQLYKNLESMKIRVAQDKKEREKKHADRAAAELAKDKGKDNGKVKAKKKLGTTTGNTKTGFGSSEDVPLAQQAHETRRQEKERLAREAQEKDKALSKKMPAKSPPSKKTFAAKPLPLKKIPAAKQSTTKKSPAKKTAEREIANDSSSDDAEFFLAPEQIIDTGIGTRSKTREKRDRVDVDEEELARNQAKRLRKN